MRILFDANFPPALPEAITRLSRSRPDAIEATSIQQVYGRTDIEDSKWISELDDNDIVAVITQDYLDKTPQEIAAYKSAEVPFFYLARACNKMKFWKKCALVVQKWPTICSQVRMIKGASEFEIPNDRGDRLTAIKRRRR